MKRMTVECGCERGGDCTHMSNCSADSLLQDQAEEYEREFSTVYLVQHGIDDETVGQEIFLSRKWAEFRAEEWRPLTSRQWVDVIEMEVNTND